MEAALPELGWGARGPQDCPESQAIHSHLDPSQGPPAWESGCRAAGRGLQQPQEEQKRAQRGERGVRASGDSGVAASSLLVTGRMTAPRPRTPWPPTPALVPGEETAVSPQQLRPRAPAGQLRWGMNG